MNYDYVVRSKFFLLFHLILYFVELYQKTSSQKSNRRTNIITFNILQRMYSKLLTVLPFLISDFYRGHKKKNALRVRRTDVCTMQICT